MNKLTPAQEISLSDNKGELVSIKTLEGQMDAYVFQTSASSTPKPAVVMFMDAFGVRPALFEMARKLSNQGFYVLLPNLYYRYGVYEPFDVPTAFSLERERIMGMMQSLTPAIVTRDFGSILGFIEEQTGAKSEKLGVVGYCMGGPLALTVAGVYSSRVKAVASIHGGRLATESPESPHLLADMIDAKIYIAAADQDSSFDDSQRERLINAFETANLDYQIEDYPGAMHGFAVPDLKVFNPAAAKQHWQRLTNLFDNLTMSDK